MYLKACKTKKQNSQKSDYENPQYFIFAYQFIAKKNKIVLNTGKKLLERKT